MAQNSATPDAKSSPSPTESKDTSGDETKAAAPKAASDGAQEASKGEDEASGDDKPTEPEISMHQFLRVSGLQPDQSAGFVRWAQKNMAGRYGLTAWKQALADFWRAPAR